MSLFDETMLRSLIAEEISQVINRKLYASGRTKTPDDGSPSVAEAAHLWTVDEVAIYLRMSRSWVYDQAAAGLLPCRKLGTATRFDAETVRAFARGDVPATMDSRLAVPRKGG